MYAGLILVLAARHEPWFDEAQAWLLVRDLSLWDLLAHYLRYEGHPSLWYLVLWIPVKMGMPYSWLPVIPAAIAIITTWLVLRFSPFPRFLTAMIPFGYFFLYQYAVIARNYVLIPLGLILLLVAHRRLREHPWPYAIMLLFLSHTSVHGAIIATSFLILDLVSLLADDSVRTPFRHPLWIVAVVFVCSILLMVWQLWLPRDVVYTAGKTVKDPVVWMNQTFSGIGWLSAVIFGVSMIWMERQRVLLYYLVPVCGLMILFMEVFKIWHEGLLFLTWFSAMWLASDRERNASSSGPAVQQEWSRFLRRAVYGVIALVFGIQIVWAAKAYGYDVREPYSGGKACAKYLHQHQLDNGSLFLIGYNALGVQPYVDRPLFYNYSLPGNVTFWLWSVKDNPFIQYRLTTDLTGYLELVQRQKPRRILLGLNEPNSEDLLKTLLDTQPYRQICAFPGEIIWKGVPIEQDALVLLERTDE